jgi:salicylate 5-hydroxylase large subunit
VSADDGEVIEFSQQSFESKPFHRTLAELGGHAVEDTEHMVTETLIRGMYRYWRDVMESPEAAALPATAPEGSEQSSKATSARES